MAASLDHNGNIGKFKGSNTESEKKERRKDTNERNVGNERKERHDLDKMWKQKDKCSKCSCECVCSTTDRRRERKRSKTLKR
jgi:hypothetical protein